MSLGTLTLIVVLGFIGILFGIAYLASRSNVATPDDYIVGGRSMGAIVLLMTMGATYFSTWTLLGAFGSYYRSGVWFIGFAVWTIFHALFIWLFGVRIWMAGKKYGHVTPGQMIEHYYKSPSLRLLFASVGIAALVPYMLIQVTGGAKALSGLTDGAIPYTFGVIITTLMVGILVLWAGFRGAAWTDTFMGVFFGSVLLFVFFFIVGQAGGLDAFRNVADSNPEVLVNKGDVPGMVELWLGLGFGSWILPHMWQKYYSAASGEVLGKVAVLTPFWNSWMMACIPLAIGVIANINGLIPGVQNNSDALLPLFFAEYAPYIGTVVVAGILAAAISTINSQLLSSASLVAEDIWVRFFNPNTSPARARLINRVTVVALTLIVFVLALTPQGSGLLVPIAALGFGIGLQMVPAALGVLYFRRITPAGALSGLATGILVLTATAVFGITTFFGPGLNGILANLVVTVAVSVFTSKVSSESVENYHGMYEQYLSAEEHEEVRRRSEQPAG